MAVCCFHPAGIRQNVTVPHRKLFHVCVPINCSSLLISLFDCQMGGTLPSRACLLFLTLTLNFTRLSCFLLLDSESNTLLQGKFLASLNNLTSASKVYTLQFFNFSILQRWAPYDFFITEWYLGIWAGGECVWLANQNAHKETVLTLDFHGNLEILFDVLFRSQIKLYSSNALHPIKASATLQNDGNFVLSELNSDGSKKRVLWQSFDHPSYLLVPGMRLGINNRTRHKWSLTSWTGHNTPATGSFTLGMDPNNTKQLVIWWQGRVYWTSGAQKEDGSFPDLKTNPGVYFTYISNENETYFNYCSSLEEFAFIGLNPRGELYGKASVSCNSDTNPADVNGCVLLKPPECREQYTYVSMLNMKHGYASKAGYKSNQTEKLSLYDCGVRCLNDCSCVAYAGTISNDTGCEIWSSDTDFLDSSDGRPIYYINHSRKEPKEIFRKLWMTIMAGLVVMLIYIGYILWAKLYKEAENILEQEKLLSELELLPKPSTAKTKGRIFIKNEKTSHEMQIFCFDSIKMATDNFSSANKLGEGGFGPVYKGILLDGQEIAIKRLSTHSSQGLTEFKIEAKLIAKLQHNNLVKLHGVCIERGERMLIYEYMPNKSLDFYLFGSNNRILLNWKTRFHIIQGIAQGLVYLHDYSRIRVIHRDLKPSNILLDNEMNSKISDFGMARIFELKESQENTNRVVGTRGYMSPEYIMNGIVSTKVDVFSFGVILLEIVSGKKISSYHYDLPLNLIGHAWQLWNEGRALLLKDPLLDESCTTNEILRCIHVGLLCVQDQAKDRPDMKEVVSFLSSDTILQDEPKHPGFFVDVMKHPKILSAVQENCSLNALTISTLDGRT